MLIPVLHKKARSRRYPAQTITNADYADDIRLLANTLTQAESLQHSIEQAAGGIGLHMNADKTEYICLNQKGDITLNGSSLNLMDKFAYLRNSVSSTENNINMRQVKSQTAIDRLSIIWKSKLPDKIKCNFFPCSGCVNSTKWMHHMDADEAYGEKGRQELHKNVTSHTE